MEFLLLALFVPFLCGDLFGGNEDGDDSGGDPQGADINGSAGNDTLAGTEQAEDITAGAGDDFVAAWSGNDILHLDDGDDAGLGENGDDLIFGGAGSDVVDGGAGNDTIWLGDGDDAIADDETFSGLGLDTGSDGDDRISGGDGNDVLGDWLGSDTLTGDLGRDLVFTVDEVGSGDAPDLNSGGWGMDILIADDGDTLSGGGNDDVFAVVTDELSDAAVTVTDFDGATEQLHLEIDPDTLGFLTAEDVTMTTDPDTGDVSILARDQVMVVLTNPTQFDMSNVVLPGWMQPAA